MNSCTHLMAWTVVINIINGLSYVILRKECESLFGVISITLDMKSFSTHKTEYLETRFKYDCSLFFYLYEFKLSLGANIPQNSSITYHWIYIYFSLISLFINKNRPIVYNCACILYCTLLMFKKYIKTYYR